MQTDKLQEKQKLSTELDILVGMLDEHTDYFCQRIEYMRIGKFGKAKFIDEKILPIIDKKIHQQVDRLEKRLSEKRKNNEAK